MAYYKINASHKKEMKIKLISINFILLVLFYASFAFAGDYEDGVAAFNAGHDDQAFGLIKPLADAGDAKSQNFVGFMYSIGIGDNPTDEKSTQYYKLSAEQGYQNAQENLARLYLSGQGVKKSTELAIKWYEKAASQGSKTAEKELHKLQPPKFNKGFSLYNNKRANKENKPLTGNQIVKLINQGNDAFVAGDSQKSLEIFKQVAQAGNAIAQTNLSIQYAYGIGTTINKEKALYWLNKALAQDYYNAYYLTGKFHLNGIFYPKSKLKAHEYFMQAKQRGSIESLYELGKINEDWHNLSKALKFYKQAAEADYPEAQAMMGLIHEGNSKDYINENIVTVDLEKSMQWYLKAAQNGFHYAIYMTGYNYEVGRGVKKSLAKAQYWYKQCAKMGGQECVMSLSKEQQLIVKQEIYQIALTKAKAGDVKAQFALAQAFKYGDGVEKSTVQTEHWLSLAAEHNYSKAMAELAEIYANKIDDPQAIKKSNILYRKLAQKMQEPRVVVSRAIDAYEQGNYKLAFALAQPYADANNKFAQLIIGKMYNFGRGVETSKEKSESYFLKASEPSQDTLQKTVIPEAQYNLGFLYDYSYNNPQLAAKWYAKAATAEHPDALSALALLYDMGRGVAHDKNKVIALYARAEAAGDKRAASNKKTAQAELRIEQQQRYQSQLKAKNAEIKRLAKQAIEERKQAREQATIAVQTFNYPKPKKKFWSWNSFLSKVVNQTQSQRSHALDGWQPNPLPTWQPNSLKEYRKELDRKVDRAARGYSDY